MTAKLQIYKDSLELVKILYRAMPEMPQSEIGDLELLEQEYLKTIDDIEL